MALSTFKVFGELILFVKHLAQFLTFEDMMSRFKQVSDEKMTMLKKAPENRRTGFSKRNGK